MRNAHMLRCDGVDDDGDGGGGGECGVGPSVRQSVSTSGASGVDRQASH